MSPDTVFFQVTEIIKIIHNVSPNIRVYIFSVVPACKEHSNMNEVVREVNSKLKPYCEHTGIPFIDLYSQLGDRYTFDGVHLNLEGYRVWALEIEQYMKE